MENNTNKDKFPIIPEVASLSDLMKKEYVIPVYQRPYAWGEEQLDDFLSTVYEGYSNGKKKCFFGTMQFNDVNGNLEVVDGQQRLTTIKLFLQVLKILSDSSDGSTISINYKNSENANDDINRLLSGFSTDYLNKTSQGYHDISEINNRFEANIRMLYMKTKNLFGDNKEGVSDLKNYFVDSLYVVVLTTKDSEMSLSEIVDIFNTINTTGMDLNGSDVFKIQYFDYLRKKDNDDIWMEKINKSYGLIDEFNSDKPQKEHFYMNDALTVYKHCICAVYGKKFEDLSKSNESFFEEIFKHSDEYSEMLEYEVFNEIVKLYIDLLEKLEKNALCCGTMATWAYRLILKTRYSRYWTIPFVWSFSYWYKHRSWKDGVYEESVKAANEILKYFVVNSTRYARVIYPVQSKTCNEIFPELLNNDFEKLKGVLSACVWNNPYDLNSNIQDEYNSILVDDGMNKSRYGIDLACIILAVDEEINNKTSDEKIREMFFSDKPFDVEHTYSRAEFDKKDTNLSEADKRLMNGLGNLILLERKINQDMGRAGVLRPVAKSDGKWYEKSEYQVARNLIGILKDWGTESVKEYGEQRIKRLDELLTV